MLEVTRAEGANPLSTPPSRRKQPVQKGKKRLKANLAGGNTFTTGKQILAASATGYASINVPAGVLPTTIAAGDMYLLTGGDTHIQFIDTTSNVQELAYLSDVQPPTLRSRQRPARAEAAEATLHRRSPPKPAVRKHLNSL